MEGQYCKFYGPNGPWARNEITDFDEILNSYLMPIEDIQKAEYLTTKYSTTAVLTPSETPASDNKSSKSTTNSENLKENIAKIQFSQQKIKQRQVKEKKLQNNQTLNLNSYFHQQISNYLKQLTQTNIFNTQQQALINDYSKSAKNFNSHIVLFKSGFIKTNCISYLQSSEFISRILASNKMSFRRKKNVIKYTQKFIKKIDRSELSRTWKS